MHSLVGLHNNAFKMQTSYCRESITFYFYCYMVFFVWIHVYPLFSGWTFMLYPVFAYYEQDSYKHSFTGLSMNTFLFFMEKLPKIEFLDYRRCMFNFVRNCQIFLPRACLGLICLGLILQMTILGFQKLNTFSLK
jgi:hypothetical protein